MDDGRRRDNGRYRMDEYRQVHAQWMMPQHQIKDQHTIKLAALAAERDNALRQCSIALSEKKVALAERDVAILQRDAAIAERNTAFMERDNAHAALEFARQKMNGNARHTSPDTRSAPLQLSDAPFDHTRGMHISDGLPISSALENPGKVEHSKHHRKETNAFTSKKASKSPKKSKTDGDVHLDSAIGEEGARGGNDHVKIKVKKDFDWMDQDLGLNLATFDESTVPPPACSCTGRMRQCYRWGNGGWQSSCCTTKLSEYPLPMMPNKPRARVGGRKMSGSAFRKLLTRLAGQGYDLSVPLDLKDHWAKHGTNRFVTVR